MTSPADIPRPLPWDQRVKQVEKMPGGNTRYIDTLREICEKVIVDSPTHQNLSSWIQDRYVLPNNDTGWKMTFLRKYVVLETPTNSLTLNELASHWYRTQDDGILIALLHSQTQFFGEMLAELQQEPRSTEELRQLVKNYGLNWKNSNQINRRVGWLRSANLIEPVGNNRWSASSIGGRDRGHRRRFGLCSSGGVFWACC